MKWIVVDIGCLECYEDSNIVGVFDDEIFARRLAKEFNDTEEKNGIPQHVWNVYPMPNPNVINEKYSQ